MNKFMCFLTGGHKYSDANIRTETAPDDFDIVILTNPCVKCGELFVIQMNVKKQIENDVAERLRSQACFICCPMCDEDVCVGRESCEEIKRFVEAHTKRKR